MNIDYNLYKIFLYLFEEKSISKTAAKLYVSQPAISYSLKELETQLGYTLFYRNSKGIEPTQEAKELYGYISTAFHILNDAEEHIKNLNDLTVGKITIGIPASLNSNFIIKYIEKFNTDYPNIQYEILTKSTDEMISMLETRKIDIMLSTQIPTKKELDSIKVTSLNYSFVYSKNMKREVEINTLKDIEKYPLIFPSKHEYERIRINELLDENHLNITPLIETDSINTMLELIRSGIGIGFLNKESIDDLKDKDDFIIINIKEEIKNSNIYCFYINDYLTNATSKFIKLLGNNK